MITHTYTITTDAAHQLMALLTASSGMRRLIGGEYEAIESIGIARDDGAVLPWARRIIEAPRPMDGRAPGGEGYVTLSRVGRALAEAVRAGDGSGTLAGRAGVYVVREVYRPHPSRYEVERVGEAPTP